MHSHLVVCEFELLHLSVDDGGALPVRRRLRDERLRPLQAVTRRLGVRVHCAACKTDETPMKSRARYSASEVRYGLRLVVYDLNYLHLHVDASSLQKSDVESFSLFVRLRERREYS